MKIEINYLNKKLITEINNDLLVKDLFIDLKYYLNKNDNNFILFDRNNHKLKENDIISISQDFDKIILYLIDSSLNENRDSKEANNLNNSLDINQLIMICTDAKNELKQNFRPKNKFNFLEFFEKEEEVNNNFSPFNFYMGREDGRNLLINRKRNRRIRRNLIEPKQAFVEELKEMGFPEDKARQALISTNNNLERSAGILLEETEN